MTIYLERRFEKKLLSTEIVDKVDLDVINYLSGKLKKYIKLNFRTIGVRSLNLSYDNIIWIGFTFCKRSNSYET